MPRVAPNLLRIGVLLLIAVSLLLLRLPLRAAEQQPGRNQDDVLQINTAGPLSLDDLMKLATRETGIRFAYPEDIGKRQIFLRTPQIPAGAAYRILGAALRTEGLAIVDMGRENVISRDSLHSKSHVTPWHGFETRGNVDHTIVRGD